MAKSVDEKNGSTLCCSRCQSVILKPGFGVLIEKSTQLPLLSRKADGQDQMETIVHFWLVPDMFLFENIGFSHEQGELKYLVCADCEIGPLGFQRKGDDSCFYLCADERVARK